MSDEVKGLRKEIEAGAVVPLSRGNGRLQWDFDQALTDEKGSGFFPLVIQQKSGGKVKAVIFYSLNDSNLELLQNSHSSRDYRIPRSEISRLQAKIEEIHKLAEGRVGRGGNGRRDSEKGWQVGKWMWLMGDVIE